MMISSITTSDYSDNFKFFSTISDFNKTLESIKDKVVAILDCQVVNSLSAIDVIVMLKGKGKSKDVVPMKLTYVMSDLGEFFLFKKLTVSKFKRMIKKHSRKLAEKNKKKTFIFDDSLDDRYVRSKAVNPIINLGALNIDFISEIGYMFNDINEEIKVLNFKPASQQHGDIKIYLTMNEFKDLEKFLVKNKRYDLIL